MSDDPLAKPIQFVKGVGPARATAFASLGIRTVGELILHIPFRYERLPKSKAIGELELAETATVVGAVRRVSSSRGAVRASIVADVEDGTGRCRVRWFNSPYLRDKLNVGSVVRLTGQVDADERQAIFVNPRLTIVPEDADPFDDDRDRYEPVYRATADLASRQIARAVRSALEGTLPHVGELLPEWLRQKRQLPPRRTSIARLHEPVVIEDAIVARRRLAYDEFLVMQLAVQMRRTRRAQASGAAPIVTTPKIDERIRARVPFTLTASQDRAVAQIAADMDSTQPMARLLQGDVGSGKTAVAVYAALSCVANRRQVAMLAPTEILARQTYQRFAHYLEGSRVRFDLLVGAMDRKQRDALRRSLEAGQLDLIVGTHALLEEDVQFRSLGLVIVDEQHRFGVGQRQRLRSKGIAPHYLVMTATPIPRTLAMTVYGDLDVTTIDELPPNRGEVETQLIGEGQTERAWEFVRSRLSEGERAYIIYPLVEESETLDLKAATAQVESLRAGALRGFKLGLLHGRMTSREKSDIVAAFRSGRIDALVSTTVVEVGVDVPEATVMVVEHAERYGLSQLHQLRGRIGRGSRRSYCLLMSDSASEESRTRLAVLCSTSNGFEIAEADLKLRGPGELAGTRQHGVPAFRVADLASDFDLLIQARDDAAELLQRDPGLRSQDHAALGRVLRQQEAAGG